MPLAPSIPIPANANGAIANFFKELNPSSVVPKKPSTRSRSPSPTITSTRHVRSTGGGGGSGSRESRSPTSPFQPASKTMEALRPHQDDEYRMQRQAAQVTSRATKGSSHSGGTLKDLAKSGRKDDYRWLEEDDDDDDEGMDKDMGGGYRDKSHDHMRRKYHHDSEDERAEVTRPPRKRRIEQGSDDTTILSPSASLPSSTDSNHNNNGHQPIMKPMTLEAAGRQFFDQLLGK
ncbi:hypothetical protein BGZ73_006507 [Actinomortierella ambigua]|nr:hypothetical protein BGZ73_006507 [Actinomortierella ambigua]